MVLVLPWLTSQRLSRSSWAGNSWAELISRLSDSGGSAQLWSRLSTSFNRLSYKLTSKLGYTEHLITLSCFPFRKKPSCFEWLCIYNLYLRYPFFPKNMDGVDEFVEGWISAGLCLYIVYHCCDILTKQHKKFNASDSNVVLVPKVSESKEYIMKHSQSAIAALETSKNISISWFFRTPAR